MHYGGSPLEHSAVDADSVLQLLPHSGIPKYRYYQQPHYTSLSEPTPRKLLHSTCTILGHDREDKVPTRSSRVLYFPPSTATSHSRENPPSHDLHTGGLPASLLCDSSEREGYREPRTRTIAILALFALTVRRAFPSRFSLIRYRSPVSRTHSRDAHFSYLEQVARYCARRSIIIFPIFGTYKPPSTIAQSLDVCCAAPFLLLLSLLLLLLLLLVGVTSWLRLLACLVFFFFFPLSLSLHFASALSVTVSFCIASRDCVALRYLPRAPLPLPLNRYPSPGECVSQTLCVIESETGHLLMRPICLTRTRLSITSCERKSRRRWSGWADFPITPSLTSHDQLCLDSYLPFLTAHNSRDLQSVWRRVGGSSTLARTVRQRCMRSVHRPRFHVPQLTSSLPQTRFGSGPRSVLASTRKNRLQPSSPALSTVEIYYTTYHIITTEHDSCLMSS